MGMVPPPARPAGRALIGQAATDGRRGARRAARRAVDRRGAGRTSAWVSEGCRPRSGAGRDGRGVRGAAGTEFR